jgi:hypothetical protein
VDAPSWSIYWPLWPNHWPLWPIYWPLWSAIGQSGLTIDHNLKTVGGIMRVCLTIKGPDFHCFWTLVLPLTFKDILETLQWLSVQKQTTLDSKPQDFSIAQVRFKTFTNHPNIHYTKPTPKVSVLYTFSYKNLESRPNNIPHYLLTIAHWLIYCLDKSRSINTSHQN